MRPLALLVLAACTSKSTDDTAPVVDSTPVDTVDTAPIDSGDSEPPREQLYDAADLDRIVAAATADLDAANASGVQLAVWRGGRLAYIGQLGTTDPEGKDPVTVGTHFQIGSDTKKLTAIAALQEVAAGTLTLDSTVAEVVPAVALAASPDWAGAATLHDLLSHQGGLTDYTPWNEAPDDSELLGVATGDLSTRGWAMSDPGAFWNYANPNFSVAGLLTETASGTPWADRLEDGVLAPLGMTETYARRSEVEAAGDYAVGNGVIFDGEWDSLDPWHPPGATIGRVAIEDTVDNAFTRPAGLVWSTASDMARLGGFFEAGDTTVLPDDLRTAMTTKQVLEYPAIDVQGYGYGWEVVDLYGSNGKYYDIPVWMHGGNTLTMTSLTWVFPTLDLSISILSNGYGDDFSATASALVKNTGLLPDPVDAPVFPSDETDHASLVGDYEDHLLGVLTVADVDGALTLSAPALDAWGIPYDPTLQYAGVTDVYFVTLDGVDYDVTFLPDESGAYTWMRNRQFVGKRVETFGPTQVPSMSAELPAQWALAAVDRPNGLRWWGYERR